MSLNLKSFIKIIKNYYNSQKSNNSNDQNYYLTTFDASPGFVKLHELQEIKINFIYKYFFLLKNFFAASRVVDFNLINKENIKNYDTIVLTWGRYNNFSKKGDFIDPYFNENSKKYKNILWFIISLDNKLPLNINNNIVVFVNQNSGLINIKNTIKLIFKKIFLSFLVKSSSQFSYIEQISVVIWQNVKKNLEIKKLKKIIMPYEGQPFQNYLNNKMFLINKKIETIGYVHATQAFPIHLFKRSGAPKKLLVHGKDQRYHLNKYLGWKKNEVKLIPSLKIRKKNKINYQNLIYLPYIIKDINFYLDSFRHLLINRKNEFSSKLKVKIHPLRRNKRTHLILKKEIELLISKTKLNKKLKFCNPIVMGTSSVVLEILENNLSPYHIYDNFLLQSYFNGLWPSIHGKTVLRNKIYQYKLKKMNNCINIVSKKQNIF